MEKAEADGLDLVEISSHGDIPVCKIMDYSKFRYERERKAKEARKRQKIIHLKEIKFRPKTEDHDYQYKLRHITRFLKDGDKVKITIRFRGRELMHKDLGMELIERIVEELKEISRIEKQPVMEGRNITLIIAPL